MAPHDTAGDDGGVELEARPASRIAAAGRSADFGRVRSRRRIELAQSLVLEIQQLRGAVRRTVDGYERRMDAQLAEVLRQLQGGPPGDDAPRVPSVKAAEGMIRAIRRTEVKPPKGRAKDLVRLQELVAELTELLPPRDP